MSRSRLSAVHLVLLISAVLLTPFLVTTARAAEPFYNFVPEEALRYRYKKFFQLTYKAKEGKTKVSRTGESVFEFMEDQRGVRAQIREFKSKIAAPPFVLVFDSRKTYSAKQADANPIVAVLSQVPGESFYISMDKQGVINRVYGFSDLLARSTSRALTGTNVLSKKLESSFSQVFSEEELRAGMSIIMPSFPEGKLNKGLTFERQEKSEADGITLTFVMHYKVTNCRGKLTCTVSGPLRLSVGGQQSPKDGSIKGSVVFDLKKNRLVYSSIKTFLKLPNVSITTNFEMKLEKELPIEDVGPLSFEKPLRSMLKLVERRVVKAATRRTPVPVYSSSDGDDIALLLCRGDVVRVVGKADGKDGVRLRIVTMLGREGWIDEKATEPYEPKAAKKDE